MRFELDRGGRVTAAVSFYALGILAFGLLAGLSGLVTFFAPLYETCASLWDNLLHQVSSPGVLLPVVVAGSAVVVAGLTLVRQWRDTQRLLNRLAPYRVPVPPRLARIAQEVGLEDRIDCVSVMLPTPFCYGFVQPRVCVPIAMLDLLDDSELRAVLRHEGYHARSRDPLKVWLSRALGRGLYFLPLAGDLRDSYLTAKEVAADEMTAQADELPLASALVKLLSADERSEPALRAGEWPAMHPLEVTAGALGRLSIAGLISITREPANETEERIRRLIDGRPAQLKLPSITSVLLSVAVVVAIFAVSYVNLSAASALPASQECAAQKALERPETGLWQAPGEVSMAAPAGVQSPALTTSWPETNALLRPSTVARLDVAGSSFDCDLLIPDCPNQRSLSSERY